MSRIAGVPIMAKPRLTCSCGHSWLALPDESDRFCPRCGEPIRAEPSGSQAISAEVLTVLPVLPPRPRVDEDEWALPPRRLRRPPQSPQSPQSPTKSGFPVAILLGIFLAVVFAGVAGAFFFVRMAARNARAARIASVPTTV